jgi:hypothetical protein
MTPGMANIWHAAALHRAGNDTGARKWLAEAKTQPFSEFEPPGEPVQVAGNIERYQVPFSPDVLVDRSGAGTRIMHEVLPNLDVWIEADAARRITSIELVEKAARVAE